MAHLPHAHVTRYLIIVAVLTLLILPAAADMESAFPGREIFLPPIPSILQGEHSPSPTGATPPPTNGGTDPFAVIDEKLAPTEAGALKSVIQDSLHAFSYDAATSSWTARNYAGQVLFTYTKDGTAMFSCGEDSFGLSLLGVGRVGDLTPAGIGVAQATGRRLQIARVDYTEWYLNNNDPFSVAGTAYLT
ncbi:MAG: hypothetical protein NT074_00730 [Methanomicrobiales archaeon]|nr:hypothetical protein [Methanomicrobiales archaeon]